VWKGHTDEDQDRKKLYALARQAKAAGKYTLEITATTGRAARQATLQYSFAAVRLVPPGAPRGNHSRKLLPVWVVRVWESDPPRGAEPLEWFLLTNEPVESASSAREVIGWYECRWVIEEYHKAQKTGCDIERMQFTAASRLEPMIALQSIVALTLLNLRDLSRQPEAQTTAANEVVAQEYVDVLSMWRHGEIRADWTVHEFFLALARLGGHQNRRKDKRPGWLVLWRGWTDLQLLTVGWQLKFKRKKVG
jgi:hypothetical protein